MKIRQRLRKDGEETKKKIINCAGRLFAEKGYDAVTGKEICERADVNGAALNYYFGGRKKLYLAVLSHVEDSILSLDTLRRLYEAPYTAEKKMEILIDMMTDITFYKKDWTVILWMKELMNPSEALRQVFRDTGRPKFSILAHFFSDYTGYSADDPLLYSTMLSLIAPFGMALIGRNRSFQNEISLQIPGEVMADNLKKMSLAHLKQLKNIG